MENDEIKLDLSPTLESQLAELVKKFNTKDHSSPELLEELLGRIQVYSGLHGCDQSTAVQHVLANTKQGMKAAIPDHIAWLKSFCRAKWAKQDHTFTIGEFYNYAASTHGYGAKSPRGLGDSIGAGHGKGLYLDYNTTAGKKHFRIPDPELYGEWYSSENIALPFAYYPQSAVRRIVGEEMLRKRAGFLSRYSSELIGAIRSEDGC